MYSQRIPISFQTKQIELFEVSPYRSEILKDIDQSFSDIKKDFSNIKSRKKLISNIRSFTGINHIVLTVKKDFYNASIIPVYNQNFSIDIINIFKNFEASEDVKTLEVVEEPSKYISKIYVIFGEELIKDFTPRELTSILLHELGHAYIFTSNVPRLILHIINKISSFVGKVLSLPIWTMIIAFPIYLSSLILAVVLTRSLTFLDHKEEYKADQFSAKYGYGDEMIKVLYTIHKMESKNINKQSWFEKIINFVKEIFSPSSHPKSSKRISELSDGLIDDYKGMYPKISKELDVILQDVKKTL